MVARRVAVLMGGLSAEREVSLRSGQSVAKALEERGHKVIPIVVNDETVGQLEGLDIDVAFIALHGSFGEDGGIQSLLESKGIPYTGSGVKASRLAMDKEKSKEVFMASGLPTAEFSLLRRGQPLTEVEGLLSRLPLPLVVKPSRNGSSVGVSIVKEVEALPKAVEDAFLYDDKIILERYIQGRELTVGILGQEALPVIEIRSARDFYDFVAKYKDKGTEYIVDPQLPRSLYQEVQWLALQAHLALGCSGFSRVDMMCSKEGRPYILEINTIPGFTERSLLPKAAQAAGVGLPELCQRIMEMALRDYCERFVKVLASLPRTASLKELKV
ncbi:MAG: D-alanine--D-alanine ligase [Candidatus Brocadiales bacterium]|nr:D-alanine--D-alanine ligase [Candidatus Brocadiales bacterium]